MIMVSRRKFLSGAAASLASVSFVGFPLGVLAQTAPGCRFVFVNCFGGADGLDMIRPLGDAQYQTLRQAVPGGMDGLPVGTLDGIQFALNPKLKAIHDLYTAGQALLFHAVGFDYSKSLGSVRSHFSSQNMLATMSPVAYALNSGFLGRLVELRSCENLSVSDTLPAVLRGKKRKLSSTWSADPGQMPDSDFMNRIDRLMAPEPGIRNAIKKGHEDALTALPELDKNVPVTMELFGKAMEFAKIKGIPIIATEIRGWDAHANEWTDKSGYQAALVTLNGVVQSIRASLNEEEWQKTVVFVCSEFGRTARPNGTKGTDHGTGTMAMVLGGAVKGGKMAGSWPGLNPEQLWEGRDLKATTNILELEAAVLQTAFRLSKEEQIAVFGAELSVPPELSPGRIARV